MVLPPALRPASTRIIVSDLGGTMYLVGTTPVGPLPAGAVFVSDGVAFLDGISYLPSNSPIAPRPATRTHLGPTGRALLHRLGLR